MNTAFFLIVIAMAGSGHSSQSVVPMESMELCETAAQQIRKTEGLWYSIKTMCVRSRSE